MLVQWNGGYNILQGMQSSMDSVGRVSQSLQMTFDVSISCPVMCSIARDCV